MVILQVCWQEATDSKALCLPNFDSSYSFYLVHLILFSPFFIRLLINILHFTLSLPSLGYEKYSELSCLLTL